MSPGAWEHLAVIIAQTTVLYLVVCGIAANIYVIGRWLWKRRSPSTDSTKGGK